MCMRNLKGIKGEKYWRQLGYRVCSSGSWWAGGTGLPGVDIITKTLGMSVKNGGRTEKDTAPCPTGQQLLKIGWNISKGAEQEHRIKRKGLPESVTAEGTTEQVCSVRREWSAKSHASWAEQNCQEMPIGGEIETAGKRMNTQNAM